MSIYLHCKRCAIYSKNFLFNIKTMEKLFFFIYRRRKFMPNTYLYMVVFVFDLRLFHLFRVVFVFGDFSLELFVFAFVFVNIFNQIQISGLTARTTSYQYIYK